MKNLFSILGQTKAKNPIKYNFSDFAPFLGFLWYYDRNKEKKNSYEFKKREQFLMVYNISLGAGAIIGIIKGIENLIQH